MTSRASSLKRLSWATVVSWIRAPSRKIRTREPRRTTPLVTMQPAIVPSARDAEQRAHLDLADDGLGLDRREHPDERLLDLLGQLVDDAVLADLDPLPLGELRGPRSTAGR